mmetsp:Transcript_102325/g.298369  ORF Transcript_102325/g.298369 Transcript_102325/m.298369 type:complete len:352 (-) Transcript_102325:142-1197(-)
MSTEEIYLPPGKRDELHQEVDACDREAESARKASDQQQLLEHLERGLHLRRKLYVESSKEVTGACRRLCEACNFAATTMLQQENLKGAHHLLKRAEQVADKCDLDRAITWNNLACYYRRTGKLRTAVTFLERALAIEEHTGNADSAQTHLNLCATLSQLQRHSDALYHAQSALIRIYEILSPLMLSGDLSDLKRPGNYGDEKHEQVTVLCIAYHNLAVEHEYLKNFESAVCTYAEGLRWATRFLSEGHQLIGILRDSVEAVKGKLPASSRALKRTTDLMQGWSKPGARADQSSRGRRSSGSDDDGSASERQLSRLITPRGKSHSPRGPSYSPRGRSHSRGDSEASFVDKDN